MQSDEIKDPTKIASPVLELTFVEMAEGRNVFEVPSNIIRSRLDETDSVGSEDLDTLIDVMEEATSRKHRHQHSSRIIHISHEEQADEAVLRTNNQPLKSYFSSSTAETPIGKPRMSSHSNHHQVINRRLTSSPVPTLATLEDHDLLRETEAEETTRDETDESRNLLRPVSIFMQRMMQQHHQQQQNKCKKFQDNCTSL